MDWARFAFQIFEKSYIELISLLERSPLSKLWWLELLCAKLFFLKHESFKMFRKQI